MTVTAAVIRACPVMAVLLICCLDISAGLSSAWLRFSLCMLLDIQCHPGSDLTSVRAELTPHLSQLTGSPLPPSITLGACGLMGRVTLLLPK